MKSEIARCVGRTLSSISHFPNLKFPQIVFIKKDYSFSWIIWSVLVPPRINNIGLRAQGHVQKSRNHKDEGFEGPVMESYSYKFQLKQNNITELLLISFHKCIIKIAPNPNNISKMRVCPGLSGFSKWNSLF